MVLPEAVSSADFASAGFTSVRGQLTCGTCTSYSNFVVNVEDPSHNTVGSFYVSAAGDFEVSGLRPGQYMATVRTLKGEVVCRDFISVSDHSGGVSIHLPDKAGQGQEVPSGTVSVAQLKHKVPKQARKEFNKAEALFEKKDVEGSLEHLRRATELDPEYLEAQNNLGSRLLYSGKAAEALSTFQQAAKLDPSSAKVQTNIAVTMLELKQFEEAEHVARRAADMQGADARAKYILALSLYGQKKFTPEAVSLLQRSQDQFPNAKIALAAVQASLGRVSEAKTALTSYLNSGQPARRREVESFLSALDRAFPPRQSH